ncbi:MAG TPA: outer membrane beta-barrel family protein, partial [Phnomibacter sp.]|nr:outer membrane beta-barrel family protein [Phnomibacter sp.]
NTSTGYFGFGRAGLDYFMDNRNTLTITGNFVRGQFNNDETNYIKYDTAYAPPVSELTARNTDAERWFRNIGGTIGYKHLFAKPGHELTADVNVNSSRNEGSSRFNTSRFNPDNTVKGNPLKQITNSGGTSTFTVAQLDYANPISSSLKFEGGLRGQLRNFNSYNDNLVFDYNINDYVFVPSISADYSFTDRVYAAYGTLTGKAGKEGRLGYNVGLRLESSNYDGELTTTGDKFNVDFPISLFPSAFMSYKLTDRSDIQFNYTRRINRPSFFQLIPFIDYTDPLNLRVGNANLSPEFTQSFESNYSRQFNNNHSLLASAYFKYTNNLLTNYQYKDVNPVTKDSAIYNSWVNANSSTRYGFEVTSTNKFNKRFDVITNVNVYNASINSRNIEQDLNNSRTSLYAKTTLTYRLGKTNNWTLQTNADYQSKTVVPVGGGGMMGGGRGPFGGTMAAGSNGFVNPNFGVDVSIRKDIIKNKNGQGYQGSLTLSMNDVLRTRIYDITTSSNFFLQNLARRRDPQVLRLQFNWRFGKMDTNLFRRKNMKGEMEGMSEGMNMQ